MYSHLYGTNFQKALYVQQIGAENTCLKCPFATCRLNKIFFWV